jgi:hypothetical protein
LRQICAQVFDEPNVVVMCDAKLAVLFAEIRFFKHGRTHRPHYDDGGRSAAGFKGKTSDCVTRAIAIATGNRRAKRLSVA